MPAMDVVRRVYNRTNFDYEVRRLPEESPVEYALTLRWLDRWIAPGAVVADIGVGVGHYALHLAQRACTLHLVDIAERLLHTARARLHDAGLQASILGVTTTSATDLHPLADNSFDAVLLLGPLYHLCRLADRQQAVREAHRILKSRGVLFAAGINRLAYLRDLFQEHPQGATARAAFHRQYLLDGNLDPEHAPPLGFAHLTTVAEFRALFAQEFDEEFVAGVESFTGHNQKQLHLVQEPERQAWFDLVEATASTAEGLGAAEHFLFVGRKRC
jgi:ubiquinone/menaquinone biosynthesis C-methylase UbiE